MATNLHTALDLSPHRVAGDDALQLVEGRWRSLEQAVAISLFSWARARTDDDVPNAGELQGWWADAYLDEGDESFGSRLWLLQRSTVTNETIEAARTHAADALQWLVDDDIAAKVEVSVERGTRTGVGDGTDIDLLVVVHRTDGETEALRFPALWSALNG